MLQTQQDSPWCIPETKTRRNIVKTQNQKKLIAFEGSNFANVEELDQAVNEMIERVEGEGQQRRCKHCGKISRDIGAAREHAETHIDGLSFLCQNCENCVENLEDLE